MYTKAGRVCVIGITFYNWGGSRFSRNTICSI